MQDIEIELRRTTTRDRLILVAKYWSVHLGWMGRYERGVKEGFWQRPSEPPDPFVPFNAHSSCASQALVSVALCDGTQCNQICTTPTPPTSWHGTPWNFVKLAGEETLVCQTGALVGQTIGWTPILFNPLNPFFGPFSNHSGAGKIWPIDRFPHTQWN